MVIIDGMTDNAIEELCGKTPFEYANCVNMNYMKENGSYGEFDTCPTGFEVDSMNCILTLLGVKPQYIPTGRAYLEATANGIYVEENDLVLRCNLVSIDANGMLTSSCGDGLSPIQMKQATQMVSDEFAAKGMQIVHMSAYKNLLIIKNGKPYAESITTNPPHEHLGENSEHLLPIGSPIADILRDLVISTQKKLKQFANSKQEYMLFPWGCSYKQNIPQFRELFDVNSATVCSTEIVRGISIAMGMVTPRIDGATADIDTDLNNKLKMALELAKSYEFVLIHINGTDEASHRKNPKEKAEFLKRIDTELFGDLIKKCDPETDIMICCDHSTLSDTGNHKGGLQPFTLFNKAKAPRGYIDKYNGTDAINLMLGKL